MAKKRISEIIEDITPEFLDEHGLELYSSEFVKEGRDWFLRVYIDKKQYNTQDNTTEEEYVSTDDCELVSRFLSEKLDALDPIEQNYYLEVSSPGMDRVLFRDEDFERFTGRIVDISLYKGVNGSKNFQGKLLGIIDDKIVITDEKDNKYEFTKEQVAKTRLAVIF